MGRIIKPTPVKLVVGFIFRQGPDLSQAIKILKHSFGKIDFTSPVIDFHYTEYYKQEFGTELKRAFISFEKLIDPSRLAKIKITTNSIEQRLKKNKRRTVNIDPGYLDLAKLVLATTKDFAHRIYLNKGIYAEVTLHYQHKTFQPQAWTYPDYKTAEYISILNEIRNLFDKQLKVK